MSFSSVAIIGRPNVGKSSLLNAIAGRRVSIVEPTAGVTRDRVSIFVDWGGRHFEVVDTGGLGLVDEVRLKEHVTAQIEVAMQEADVLVFVVDAKEGLAPMDDDVAERLRRLDKPIVLVANKVEGRKDEIEAHEAWRFGFDEPHLVSAKEGFGIRDLLDAIVEKLPAKETEETPHDGLKVAIVGKRNSGKSTFVNLLAGGDRVIVSELAGTTRDAVDVRFERDGKTWVAIDTAGLRKKSRVQDAIEFFSLARAEQSIRRADLVFLMFDITETLSQVDKKLASFVIDQFKPCILVGNKLDLAVEAGVPIEKWEAYVRQQLVGLSFAPLSFMSAKDGIHIEETMRLGEELYEQASTRVSTGELNRVLQVARERLAPKGPGKIPKLFYATQVDVCPPTILVFVNEPELFTGQYDRYLQNRLREAFDWKEIPIRIVYRRREKVELPDL
ncbi:MAG: ribosome biogenesis GTPase Der [Planctomycetes bacterium]|nr:ribosome biogenesis GTPase Der [Planctomycetota bacterium]